MQVTLECNESIETDEIVIRCRHVTPAIIQMMAYASALDKKLVGNIERQIFLLDPKDAYYFESVDDKVFIYTQDQVYACALRLYEIEREYGWMPYFRASKSTILHLRYIQSLNPLLNGKIEVELQNGEKQLISRQYVPAFKKRLGI